MVLYIIGIAIVVGFGTLLWRDYRKGDPAHRDNSFFLDIVALGTTTLLVGALVIAQLSPVIESGEPGETAAAVEGTPLAENPSVPQAEPTVSLSPTATVDETESGEEETGDEETAEEGGETHVVQEGETFESIAEQYDFTVEELLALNDLDEEASPETGDVLRIPAQSERLASDEPDGAEEAETSDDPEAVDEEDDADEEAEGPAPTATPEPTPAPRQYTVKQGDTLGHIAKQFNVSEERLAATNPNIDPEALQIGQELVIPGEVSEDEAESADSEGRTIEYTVQQGDVFSVIAKEHGITSEALRAANPGVNPESLDIGQVLNIPNQ